MTRQSDTPAAERKLVVQALIAAVESLVMHRASKREAREMMTFLARRLLPARGGRRTHLEEAQR